MKSSRDAAARVVAAYLVVSVFWILFSDYAVAQLPQHLADSLQTLKGIVFVGITGALIYLLVAKSGDDLQATARKALASELLLDQVVRTVPMGILLLSEDGTITYINPAAEVLLATAARDALGRRFEEVAGGSVRDSAVDIGELLRTGAFDGLELGPKGQATIARVAPVDEGHSASGWVVAVTDVTDAQRASRRSRALVRAYRFLAMASLQMSKAHDRARVIEDTCSLAVEAGGFASVWCMVSQRGGAVTAHHYRGSGSVGTDLTQALLSAYENCATSLAELSEDGVTVADSRTGSDEAPWFASVLPESGCGSAASFAITTPDGPDVLVVVFSAEAGAFGWTETELLASVRGALSFALDRIALEENRIDAEQALGRSERAYRALFDHHPQPMWVYDLETLAFLAVNDAAIVKYAYSRDEFLAMTIADIRPEEDVALLRQNVSKVSGGFEDAGIWTHVDAKGRAFPVHVFSHAIEWEDRSAELVMVSEVARVE